MACSRFEYVKQFEYHQSLLKNCFIVVRIDGHAFTKFTKIQNYLKPNDKRGLLLMNNCARIVMEEFDDIFIGYGQSDEFSFVLKRTSTLYKRRELKIATNIVSLFTSAFVANYPNYFTEPLKKLPSFDSRCVLYPTLQNMRDYLSWRQADCHINNLYNTAFWALVNDSKSTAEAESILSKTDAGGKNELLFKLGINYNNEEEIYRKGSVLLRESINVSEISKRTGEEVQRNRKTVVVKHCDIIGDEFWSQLNNSLE